MNSLQMIMIVNSIHTVPCIVELTYANMKGIRVSLFLIKPPKMKKKKTPHNHDQKNEKEAVKIKHQCDGKNRV